MFRGPFLSGHCVFVTCKNHKASAVPLINTQHYTNSVLYLYVDGVWSCWVVMLCGLQDFVSRLREQLPAAGHLLPRSRQSVG